MKERDLAVFLRGATSWEGGIEYGLRAVAVAVGRGISLEVLHFGKWDKAARERALYTVEDLGLAGSVAWMEREEEWRKEACMGRGVFLDSSVRRKNIDDVVEAMACGLPVVVTDAGGMREAVRDGVDGFVVGVRDVEEMARALERLARDPELRRRMGEAARQRVLDEFTLEKQTREWRALYEGLAAGCDH